jgi:hypothetical protein
MSGATVYNPRFAVLKMKEQFIMKAVVPVMGVASLVFMTTVSGGCAQKAAVILAPRQTNVAALADTDAAPSRPVITSLVKNAQGFQLTRGGKPYFIKGAGGDGSQTLLHACGGNSIRTWGADNLESTFADAKKNGLTVTAGVWLGHKDNGFNYHDAAAVAAQKEMARKSILRYKDQPNLLVWAFGNEMEQGQEDDPALWQAIEDIAKMSHELDPDHPTMTVVAEIGGDKIAQINKYCPDIDIIGINSYAGASSIADRYMKAGGVKPYIITEYGPPGVWELGKNAWGAASEPTSTEKETWYRNAYTKSIANQPLCVGSYAFTWGHKQEATATWFGLLLPDGDRTGPVDTLTELWTGGPPAHPCPEIQALKVDGADRVDPGATVHVTLATDDPDKAPLKVEWVLQSDPASYHTGGGAERAPMTIPDVVVSSDATGARIKMPLGGAAYRLFAYVRDDHGGAAVGNIPLFVTGDRPIPIAPAPQAKLPLALYGVGIAKEAAYIPSGYMGNAGAIKMDPDSTDHPHSGTDCLKVNYTAGDSWGGVVWQSPANDWGDKPGGWNLTGAKRLTFWARGANGGENVTFQYGLLGKDKPYHDSATGKLPVTLTKDWTQYSIDLTGKDLSDIKTGFCWVVAGSGQGETFWLDDIRYE